MVWLPRLQGILPSMDLGRVGRRPAWLAKRSPAARRILTGLLGLALIGGGAALTPLPGPLSIPLILAGLVVLSWEFTWATRARRWIVDRFEQLAARRRRRKQGNQPQDSRQRRAA